MKRYTAQVPVGELTITTFQPLMDADNIKFAPTIFYRGKNLETVRGRVKFNTNFLEY